jgi:FtsZ-binding cell division protein ZapB
MALSTFKRIIKSKTNERLMVGFDALASSPKVKRVKPAEQLRAELERLTTIEHAMDEKITFIHDQIEREQLIENEEKKLSSGVDRMLDIILLDKEIDKIKNENASLQREIRETGQDTKILIRQVEDLISASENRHKGKRKANEQFNPPAFLRGSELNSDR